MYKYVYIYIYIYSKASLNRPATGSTLNGPYGEVGWCRELEYPYSGIVWNTNKAIYRELVDLWRWSVKRGFYMFMNYI